MKNHFGHHVGKIQLLVLIYPVTFVPVLARCSSALCLFLSFSYVTPNASIKEMNLEMANLFFCL